METKKETTEEKKKAEFKSYYVVWKLKMSETSTPYKICLNRTMQYGNHKRKKQHKEYGQQV